MVAMPITGTDRVTSHDLQYHAPPSVIYTAEAADLRCRLPASSTIGWQSSIEPDTGELVPQTLVDQHRDLVFYPQVNRKPVQIPHD